MVFELYTKCTFNPFSGKLRTRTDKTNFPPMDPTFGVMDSKLKGTFFVVVIGCVVSDEAGVSLDGSGLFAGVAVDVGAASCSIGMINVDQLMD